MEPNNSPNNRGQVGIDSAQVPVDHIEERRKLLGPYLAFVTAVLFAVAARFADFNNAKLICSLLAVSLPSLAAFVLLDAKVHWQGRPRSAVRGAAAMLGFVPSLTAFTLLAASFSIVAGIAFGALLIFWALAIFVVHEIGFVNKDSQI